jgi:hypothetical protein
MGRSPLRRVRRPDSWYLSLRLDRSVGCRKRSDAGVPERDRDVFLRGLFHRIDERVAAAARVADELGRLRSRMTRLEASLRVREAAEQLIREHAARAEAELAVAWRQVRALAERLTTAEEGLSRERRRAEAETARADRSESARGREAAEWVDERAVLTGKLEQERLRRCVTEEALRANSERSARQKDIVEQRLRRMGEALAAARAQIADQRDRAALKPAAPTAPDETGDEGRTPEGQSPPENGRHLRFFATSAGYLLDESNGALPEEGAIVPLGEHGLGVVAKLGPSPLPGDGRRCAYLIPCASPG